MKKRFLRDDDAFDFSAPFQGTSEDQAAFDLAYGIQAIVASDLPPDIEAQLIGEHQAAFFADMIL